MIFFVFFAFIVCKLRPLCWIYVYACNEHAADGGGGGGKCDVNIPSLSRSKAIANDYRHSTGVDFEPNEHAAETVSLRARCDTTQVMLGVSRARCDTTQVMLGVSRARCDTTLVTLMKVDLKLTLERVYRNEWASFRPATTGLDDALVVCDLTHFYGPCSCTGCMRLDPDTDNQCVITARGSGSKHRSFVLANSLQGHSTSNEQIFRNPHTLRPRISFNIF